MEFNSLGRFHLKLLVFWAFLEQIYNIWVLTYLALPPIAPWLVFTYLDKPCLIQNSVVKIASRPIQ